MDGITPINVLIIGSDKIASYKIGIEQPLRYLEGLGFCKFSVKAADEVRISRLSEADIVIFFRSVDPEAYKLLEVARELGKKTVYVIDDHFAAMPLDSDMGRYYHEASKLRTYVKFLKNVHIVKVASEFFSRHLKVHYNPNKVICFTGSVDFSLFNGLKKNGRTDDRIVIGYEGGRKHAAFDPVVKALRAVLRNYGDRIRLEFLGYAPEGLSECSKVFIDNHNHNYSEFLKSLYVRNWDIGLAPLENSLLHDCKTNNKFREYAACRIPGIYSAAPAYENWVINNENGLLVHESAEAWEEAIVALIEDPQLRERIKDNAESLAKEQFNVEGCAERWRSKILSIE